MIASNLNKLERENTTMSDEQFTNSIIGKKYKQAGHNWLRIDKKLGEENGHLKLIEREIPKRKDADEKVTKCDSHLYNQISNLESYLDNTPGDKNKPIVSLEMTDKQGNSINFDALIDPGSYSLNSTSNNLEIVSYISDRLYNEIINLMWIIISNQKHPVERLFSNHFVVRRD